MFKVAAVSVPAYLSAVLAASRDIIQQIPEAAREEILVDEKKRAPFAREVADCLKSLIEAGVTHGRDGPIPDSVQALWQPGVDVAAFPRRQHAISSQLTASALRSWLQEASLKANSAS